MSDLHNVAERRKVSLFTFDAVNSEQFLIRCKTLDDLRVVVIQVLADLVTIFVEEAHFANKVPRTVTTLS